MKPGDRVAGGTVVKVKDEGVYLGREADEDEATPDGHTEHRYDGGRRAFLSKDQGPIDPKSDLCKPKATKVKVASK